MRLWILLMDLFSILPQSNHIRGQYLKVDKASERGFVCSWDKNVLILVKALKRFTCCIAKIVCVFCKSNCVVNDNSQKFYFIIAFYMFVFYYKYDVVIIYWWSEKYYEKFTWITYHTINLKPIWNNVYVVR